MMASLRHVSIVVPDLDAAARRLQEIYGLVVGETRTNAEQGCISPMSSSATPGSN